MLRAMYYIITRGLNRSLDGGTHSISAFSPSTRHKEPPGTADSEVAATHGHVSSLTPPLPNTSCPPNCHCRCHCALVSIIPEILSSILGKLYVPKGLRAALSKGRTQCDNPSCKRHQLDLVTIKYYFPRWFVQVSAEIRTQRVPIYFCIRTPRVVKSLDWLVNATLDDVETKLRSRELTVNDVRPDGLSALHVRSSSLFMR